MENVSGDGKTSPFGNGKGATAKMGASSGASDFVKNPAGGDSKSGGNDFTKNPRGNSSQEGGADFVANPRGSAGDGPEQEEGAGPDICEESVVKGDGGRILQQEPPNNREGLLGDKDRKPFSLKG